MGCAASVSGNIALAGDTGQGPQGTSGSVEGANQGQENGRPVLTVDMAGGSSGARRGYRAAWTPLRSPAYPTVSFPPSMMLKVGTDIMAVHSE